MKIILASKSPRRQELLSLITEDFIIDVPKGEENCPEGIPLFSRPQYLAEQKASEIAKKEPEALIIAADTAVFYGEQMLGKPKDEQDARDMLMLLSGKTHTVITGCAVRLGDREESFSVSTEVEFYPLDDDMIENYIKTGESMDKAGAYGIQGKGALLIKGIKGDYFNVVGLPVAKLEKILKKIDLKR